MVSYKLIDSKLYADNGDGSYTGVKWCDLQSATLECKCNEDDREKFKWLILGENHYREKPNADPLSYEYISDYIYKLLSFHGQYLDEFEIIVDKSKDLYSTGGVIITVRLLNHAYQTQYGCFMRIFDDTSDLFETVNKNLNELVQRYLNDIKTKSKINMKKENDIMAQYDNCRKIEVIKTQEEIELEEKIAKLRAEYDKKIAKLREEFYAASEKKRRDAKAKELHDKYQSLIDAGFSTEQAYDILQTKMKLDEF